MLELARTADRKTLTYVSTSKVVGEDPIRLHKGTYKGKLFNEAEFIPSLCLKDVKFSFAGNAFQRAASDGEEGDEVSEVQCTQIVRGVSSSMNGQAKAHKKMTSTDTTP